VFPASAIDTLLVSAAQIRSVTDGNFYGITPGSDMVVRSSSYGMSDNANQVDPPSCVGIIFGAEHSVYDGTGFEEIRDQTLDPSSYTVGNEVEQTAVVFPSADDAQNLLAAQTKQWQTCVSLPSSVPGTPGLQMGQKHGEGGLAWTLANVVTGANLITVKMAGYDNEAGSHQACQQVLGVRVNVVIKTKACQEMIETTTNNPIFTDTSAAGNYAERIANAMLEKVRV
jgi:serine/threonine-protein kinase